MQGNLGNFPLWFGRACVLELVGGSLGVKHGEGSLEVEFAKDFSCFETEEVSVDVLSEVLVASELNRGEQRVSV